MREFESESAARHYAKVALSNGLEVDAGTLPEIKPQVRIPRAQAMAWVTSKEEWGASACPIALSQPVGRPVQDCA
jgi:hypothetical protein